MWAWEIAQHQGAVIAQCGGIAQCSRAFCCAIPVTCAILMLVMAKSVSEAFMTSLLDVVAKFPDGARVGEIAEELDASLSRRTLQYRLALLVKQSRLQRQGRGAGSRYHLPPAPPVLPEARPSAVIEIEGLTLSPEAARIQVSVTAPLASRRPVGYNRTFLDSYSPNKTHYLPVETREHLATMGAVSEDAHPPGTYLREVYDRLLIDLSWNSSRLEGNTYSLLETERLLELGAIAEGKDAAEAQMILNHKAAIELLLTDSDDIGFNRYTICNLHAVLADHLLADRRACGRLRSKPVAVTGTLYHPVGVPQMIEECFDILLDKAESIADPFEQALFVLVQLPYLQPFLDVNKRVSRLAANIPLICRNLCPLSFVDVPDKLYTGGMLGVYELNAVEYLRDVFVWAYERSCGRYSAVRQMLGAPDPFLLRYRGLLKEVVRDIVKEGMTKSQAIARIRERVAQSVPSDDQKRLIEVLETELMSLHEGNIARYRLRPSDFCEWRKSWS
jgi:hypothetical protein